MPPRAKLRLARGLDAHPRRNSVLLEGWMPPQAKLRLARGLRAPSCGTPPRSRAARTLMQDSASLEGSRGSATTGP
jgi:hypothetical protein